MLKMKLTAFIGAAVLLVGVLTTPLIAGSIGIGVTGEAILLETEGKETLKSNSVVSTAKEDGNALIASAYLQYTFGDDGFVIGVERMPGSATLGHKAKVQNDKLEGNETDTDNFVEQIAKAKVDNITSVYIETPSFGGMFAKVAYTEADLTTQETLGTGSQYGDGVINGYTVGLGFRGTADNGLHMKISGEYTDYSNISLTSTNTDVASTISGDVVSYGLKVSIGMNF